MRIAASFVALLAAGLSAPSALGDGFLFEPGSDLALSIEGVDESSAAPAAPARPHWGEEGSVTVNITGGYASDFSDTRIVPVAMGISWFPIDNFSIDVQAEAAYVTQPGPDAGGGGAAVLFRWHFLPTSWGSIYADLGIGIMGLSNDVPAGASSLVFTPRAGGGVSIKLDDTGDTRLMIGARWYHISNAQTADSNPGINALQGYIGVSFAF